MGFAATSISSTLHCSPPQQIHFKAGELSQGRNKESFPGSHHTVNMKSQDLNCGNRVAIIVKTHFSEPHLRDLEVEILVRIS